MFVQAVDNRLYEEPIIEGDGFFIKAEGLERPEIAIKYSPTSCLSSSRELAMKRFRELGMKVKLDIIGTEDIFAFPPKWDALERGASWNFDFLSKMIIPHGYKSRVDYPTPDCKFIAWELEFPIKEILEYLDNKVFHPILMTFLMGREIREPLDNTNDAKIRRLIEKEIRKFIPTEGQTLKLKPLVIGKVKEVKVEN